MGILVKRHQTGIFEALASVNRAAGSAGGTGAQPLGGGNFAAAGNQGGYSTANSSTWTDITNTSFTFLVNRASTFLYFVFATGHISAGAQNGYVRGNIVGFDTSASPFYAGANPTNGQMIYFPFSKGPLAPGIYTAKLQAATDANTTTLTIDQFFHWVLLMNQ